MVSLSDNTASLWIQAMVGGGAAVNEWLAAHGFDALHYEGPGTDHTVGVSDYHHL